MICEYEKSWEDYLVNGILGTLVLLGLLGLLWGVFWGRDFGMAFLGFGISSVALAVLSALLSNSAPLPYHKFTRYEYATADSCLVVAGFCGRCGKREPFDIYHKQVYIHEWQWEYIAEDSCDQRRDCNRCHAQETRSLAHQWEWEYIAEGLCDQNQVCHRCHAQAQERQELTHQWDEWEYIAFGECKAERVCKRCKNTEMSMNHDFETSKTECGAYDSGYSSDSLVSQKCRRCGYSPEPFMVMGQPKFRH